MKYHLIDTVIGSNEMDVARLTEDEQVALAIRMSMSQAESSSMSHFLFFDRLIPISTRYG
jgi:hypothetical protein